jgi:hypothetical protein
LWFDSNLNWPDSLGVCLPPLIGIHYQYHFPSIFTFLHCSSTSSESTHHFQVTEQLWGFLDCSEFFFMLSLLTNLKVWMNHRLVEKHIFSFFVKRAFVTDIEKLKISSKTRSLDVVKVLKVFFRSHKGLPVIYMFVFECWLFFPVIGCWDSYFAYFCAGWN